MEKIKIADQLDPHPEYHSKRNWRQFAFGLVISAIALTLVLYIADLEKLESALRLADKRLVVVGFIISLLWLVSRGFVWQVLLQDRVSFRKVFLTINEGYFLNNVFPFRLGEIGRAFLLSRKTDLRFWEVLSSIVIERTLDLALVAGLLLSTLPFLVYVSWAYQAAAGVGVVVLILFIGMYVLARKQENAIDLFKKLSARLPLLQKIFGSILTSFFSGLVVLTDKRRFMRVTIWLVINWVIGIVQHFLLLRAFFPGAKLLWGIFSLGVGALGIAAPSLPGGLGVYELSIVGSLAVFKLDASTALAFAITTHLIQFINTGAIGLFALIKDGESMLGLFSKIRQIQKEKVSK